MIQVADGQSATEVQGEERGAGSLGAIDQPASGAAEQELERHHPGEPGPGVEDVPVGAEQVETAVIIGVEEGDAEAEQGTAGRRQADGRRVVGEGAAAQVAVEGR